MDLVFIPKSISAAPGQETNCSSQKFGNKTDFDPEVTPGQEMNLTLSSQSDGKVKFNTQILDRK